MGHFITYWKNIGDATRTLSKGLGLTMKHMLRIGEDREQHARLNIRNEKYFANQKGVSTIQFPHEQLSIPDNGRYKLQNEIDDCIVCDKCVKICPVNCITIEPIRSAIEFGRTSDDSPRKIYAAKFDIDMGKCCFCGLCTTVCPTECLTMTPEFDFSTDSMSNHYFKFGNMTEAEIIQRKSEWEEYLKTRNESKSSEGVNPSAAKPVMKPKVIIPKPNK